MLIPRLTKVADMMPLAMIPAVKYWRKLTPGARDRAVEDRAEDDKQEHRQREREDDRLAGPEERLQFQRAAAQAQPGGGREPGRGRGARVGDGGHGLTPLRWVGTAVRMWRAPPWAAPACPCTAPACPCTAPACPCTALIIAR